MSVLQQTNELLKVWTENQSVGAEVPRALGMANFTIENSQGQIIARPFSLFRLQAALDVYASMSNPEREQADIILDKTGGTALKDFSITSRLTRHNYKLVLA